MPTSSYQDNNLLSTPGGSTSSSEKQNRSFKAESQITIPKLEPLPVLPSKVEFHHQGPHFMIVIAPEHTELPPDKRIRVAWSTISVSLNCFAPDRSHTITIRQSERKVAQVEIGNPEYGDKIGTVWLDNAAYWLDNNDTYWISDVLTTGKNGFFTVAFGWKHTVQWNFNNVVLLWNCTLEIKQCYLVVDGKAQHLLASLSFPSVQFEGNRITKKVPASISFGKNIDNTLRLPVLVSALIIERRRVLG
ncbi:hypothetical protein JAAARDRAFT_56022 [Jaapia argillacea MUCL 33604]|uniref:Uncharacterized protein n=1 Tax=Jaapia argillacea MUCL 33604 TaxID=933084 RepID=A0A067PZ91_9AGAM|nr:hypothetical protein JAAARDRAFT_56022 [Jaapia argillacea MUCL 33604]